LDITPHPLPAFIPHPQSTTEELNIVVHATVLNPDALTSFLSSEERARKRQLIKIVDRKLRSVIEAGPALLELRDSRLYRDTHSSFDAFCREQWHLSKTSANRLIQASEVAKNLEKESDKFLIPMGVKPTSERQVRPLTDLSPEDQREVWETAVQESKCGIPTGKEVEAAKAKIVPVSKSARRKIVSMLSLEDRLKHIGTQYVNAVCKELEDHALDDADRQRLIVVLLADFDRLRGLAKDHFLPKQP
jgi:hypothetical protein